MADEKNEVNDISAVEARLNESETYSWSWAQEKIEPLRHTAIALFFDDVPRFTINFRPLEGYQKAEALVGNCEGKITIETAKDPEIGMVRYHKVIQELTVVTDEGKSDALRHIEMLLSYKPDYYNLVSSNCRHHVLGVFDHVKRTSEGSVVEGEFNAVWPGMVKGDIVRFMLVLSAAILAVGSLIRGVVFADGVDGEIDSNDEEEKENNAD